VKKRALGFIAIVVLVGGVISGHLSVPPGESVSTAYAYACQGANPICPGGVGYKTAAVDVTHVYEAYTQPVQPDVGETWAITTYWNTATQPCAEIYQVATAQVSWNGSAWVVSNKNLTADILDIGVCGIGSQCGSAPNAKSWGYRLYAQVNDPTAGSLPGYNLRRVEFATTSVDDGNVVNGQTCTLTTAVSPTSQSFTGVDDGGWPCGYNCTSSGVTVEITYQKPHTLVTPLPTPLLRRTLVRLSSRFGRGP